MPLKDYSRLEVRDKILIARVYYFSEILNMRMDRAIAYLSLNEIFLSDQSFAKILQIRNELYCNILKEKPTAHELAKRYPGFNWNLKTEQIKELIPCL